MEMTIFFFSPDPMRKSTHKLIPTAAPLELGQVVRHHEHTIFRPPCGDSVASSAGPIVIQNGSK
jgi:hypothetical protein